MPPLIMHPWGILPPNVAPHHDIRFAPSTSHKSSHTRAASDSWARAISWVLRTIDPCVDAKPQPAQTINETP
jgi:hypothetical protein